MDDAFPLLPIAQFTDFPLQRFHLNELISGSLGFGLQVCANDLDEDQNCCTSLGQITPKVTPKATLSPKLKK